MTKIKSSVKSSKRGPKNGPRGRPVNPSRIKKIVSLRDDKGWTFSKISQHLGDDPPMTEQAVYLAYNKWRDWALQS